MLEPVNDGEEEFDDEGKTKNAPFTQHKLKYLFF